MVTSPPQSPTKRQAKNYPLFSKLLLEGLNSRRGSNPAARGLECPATAPVLTGDSYKRAEYPLQGRLGTMTSGRDDHSSVPIREGYTEDHEAIQPLTLQDPPKSKLKRQLSIDTRECQDKLRIHKKPHLGYEQDATDEHEPTTQTWQRERGYRRGDEVDGCPQSISAVSDNKGPTPHYLMEPRLKEPLQRVNVSPHMDSRLPDPPQRVNVSPHMDSRLPDQPQRVNASPPRVCVSPPRVSVNVSPSKTYFVQDGGQSITAAQATVHGAAGVGGHSITVQGYIQEMPIKSPNLFDLNDIGLTSPFMSSTTPRTGSQSKPVFIYPDSNSPRPRKTSPYKQPTPEYGKSPPSGYQYERSIRHVASDGKQLADAMYTHSDNVNLKRDLFTDDLKRHVTAEGKLSDVLYTHSDTLNITRDMFQDDLKRQPSMTAQQLDTGSGVHNPDGPSGGGSVGGGGGAAKYVTSKGFDWSLNVTITEATPFSPRVVTAEARPRYASVTTTSSSYPSPTPHCSTSRQASRSDSYDENMAKLQKLEREYKKALEILGHPDCPETLRTQVLRSHSAVDKSPNEKSIRETREDVRNRYERMFSFPIAAPRISPYMLAQRDEARIPGNTDKDIRFQHSRPWLTDARRRLFARSESHYSPTDPRSSHYGQDSSTSSLSSTDIPEEVLQFLHSKNFHPEELENLKDFIRRGGSSLHESPGHTYRSRSNTGHHDLGGEGHGIPRFDLDSDYRRSVSYDQHYGPIRDRRRGDIDVRLSCESIVQSKSTQDMLRDLEHDSNDCRCSKIEDAIRQMALQAYSKIIPADSSAASFSQFQNEFNETNAHVYDSMQFLCGVKCLCKYGRTLEDVYSGSVVFRLNCPNIDALLDLWQEYRAGNLLRDLQSAFVTDELRKQFDCVAIKLNVVISKEEYYTCKTELEAVLLSQMCTSPKKSPGAAIFHARSRSEPASVTKQANQLLTPRKKLLSPFRERFCSDSSVELSPRRAFQEINVSKDTLPLYSPSKKLDNVFFNDDMPQLTSPKRRQFPSTSPQGEQENVGQSGPRIQSPRQTTFPELPWSDSRNERVTNV